MGYAKDGACEHAPYGLALLLLLAAAGPSAADPGPGSPATKPVARPDARPDAIHVEATHNARPFDYDEELVREAPAFRVLRLRYPSPVVTPVEANNVVPGDYYVPRGVPEDGLKRPAVVCLHILHGNFELERLTCSVLASHGIPAMMIKLPYYGERAPPEGTQALTKNPALFLQALDQGFADVRRAVDLLASRREVNPKAIGIIGVSLGGIVGATAAAEEPRVARAALILAGGDLEYILDHAPETRSLNRFLTARSAAEQEIARRAMHEFDPLTHAAQLRDRALQGRVLMVNAAEDVTIAPQCTRKLAEALGIGDRVVWLPGLGHYTAIAALPQVLEHAVEFFAQDLPAEARRQTPPAPEGPMQTLGGLLGQVAALLGADPAPGRGHFVDLELSIQPVGGKPVQVPCRFARGSGGRFRLEGRFPMLDQVAVGQGAYPWIVAQAQHAFRGTAGAEKVAAEGEKAARSDKKVGGPSAGPLDALAGGHRIKLQVLLGALSAVAAAPETLGHLAEVRAEPAQGPPEAIVIAPRDGSLGEVRIELKTKQAAGGSAAVVPSRITFQSKHASGQITVRQWQIDTVAPDELFSEPPGLECQDVDPADLHRMFGAVLKFAMEQLP